MNTTGSSRLTESRNTRTVTPIEEEVQESKPSTCLANVTPTPSTRSSLVELPTGVEDVGL